MTGVCKFDELRFKTDTQLIEAAHNELAIGIDAAREALRSVETWNVAERYYLRAKRVQRDVSRLIPFVNEISADERGRVESKLESLNGMLEALSAIGSTPTPTENAVAALARALWEAKGCPEGLAEEHWFQAERVLKPQEVELAACVGR